MSQYSSFCIALIIVHSSLSLWCSCSETTTAESPANTTSAEEDSPNETIATAVSTTTDPDDFFIPTDTKVPGIPTLPLSDQPNHTTPAEQALKELFSTELSFSIVVRSRKQTAERWWVILSGMVAAMCLCSALSVLGKYTSQKRSIMSLMYDTVSKNIAIVGLTTAVVYASAAFLGESNPRWAFILSWNYYTLFVVFFLLMLKVIVAAFRVTQYMNQWSDWEVHLPRGAPAPTAADFKLNILNDVRYVFLEQVRILHPDKANIIEDLRVTAYLEYLQNSLMLNLASFNWQNWLSVSIFTAINAFRQISIANDEMTVTEEMLVTDCASYVFGLGFAPALGFALFQYFLVSSLRRYLGASRVALDEAQLQKRRTSFFRGRRELEARVNVDVNEAPEFEFISPFRFFKFGRPSFTVAAFRICFLTNALYLGWMLMSMSHAMLTRIAYGPFFFVCSFIPTVIVLYCAPWGSLLLVITCSLGPFLDKAAVEEMLDRVSADARPGLRVKGDRATARGKDGPQSDLPSSKKVTNPLTSLEATSSLGEADTKSCTTTTATANVAEYRNELDDLLTMSPPRRTAANLTADQAEGLRQRFRVMLARVHARIEQLQQINVDLHGQILTTSFARRKFEDRFRKMLPALAARPDLAAQWKDRISFTGALQAFSREAQVRDEEKRRDEKRKQRLERLARRQAAIANNTIERSFFDVRLDDFKFDSEDETPVSCKVYSYIPTSEEILRSLYEHNEHHDSAPRIPRRSVPDLRHVKADPKAKYLEDVHHAQQRLVIDRSAELREAEREAKRKRREEEREKRHGERAAALEEQKKQATQQQAAVLAGVASKLTAEQLKELESIEMASFKSWGSASGANYAQETHSKVEGLVLPRHYARPPDEDSLASDVETIYSDDEEWIRSRKSDRNIKKKEKIEREEREKLDFTKWGLDAPPIFVSEVDFHSKTDDLLQERLKCL